MRISNSPWSSKNNNTAEVCRVRICGAVLTLLLLILTPLLAGAQEGENVAVLPFRVFTPSPMVHLQRGLQEMFTSRLAAKGIPVISPDKVNRHPKALTHPFEFDKMLSIGEDLGADWIISGSLTQVGKNISLDIRVLDIARKRGPFPVFMTEDDMDKLAAAVDRAVTSIYNMVLGVEQVDSIVIKGNRRVETEAILSVIESKKGDSLDPDKLDRDLRSIFQMGYFTDVTIETEKGPKGKVVIISVKEKPSIAKISFEGNKKIKDKDLIKEIGLKLYSILDRAEVTNSINRLKDYYHKKGYYGVEIKENILELPNNEVAIVYQVNEGEKVYIREIRFIGNKEFDDEELKDAITTKEKGFFSWFTKSGLLDRKRLEFDREKLLSFYYNHGYIKAKVGEPKITYEKGKGITITIEIVEGPKYRVNEVNISGDLIMPREKLLEKVKINKEEFFNREIVGKDTLALRSIYADEGYAYAEVIPLTKEDEKRKVVDITYRISKGKKVRFERINISGNTRTRDKVIRRELKIVEGGLFSASGLKKSSQNLYRLGYFEDVQIKTKRGSRDDLMVLDIKVKEQPTGSFMAGLGYSSFDKTTATFRLQENNLFGRGQRASVSAEVGTRTVEFNIRFTEPWFTGRPISAGFDVYNFRREYDEYTKDSSGGALRLGFPLKWFDEFTRGSAKYAYDDADIRDVAETAAQEIKDMEGRNVTSLIRLGITRDSKDRLFNTTRGSLNSILAEYAGGLLGGTVAYNRIELTSAWFFPFRWETVFHIKGRLWYLRE
ncbi:MAG: outer membrane protein assembly factor BamA, partial [Deltaproteobacteria bacterium]|nr:outer membrane protein assembly factor BamA [Deltaproteobacteria bacterium]